jgi:hypothetical protein
MSGVRAQELDAAELKKVLLLALDRLHAELTSPSTVPVGTPVTASIVGAGAEIDVSDLLNGVLDLVWLRYTTAGLGTVGPYREAVKEISDSAKTGMPSAEHIPALTDLTAAGPGNLERVLGLLGLARLRVRVDVQWRLKDQNGKEWVAGNDFLAPNGLTSPNVTLLIPPIFQELRIDADVSGQEVPTVVSGCKHYLSAKVTLSVGSTNVVAELPRSTPPIDFGIPLVVLPILLPTVAAVFSNPDSNPYHPKPGLCLIMVPNHSPLGSLEQLNKVLNDLDRKVEALRGLASFAGALLGLDALTEAINTHPAVRFTRARSAPDPNAETLNQGVDDFSKIVFWKEPTKIAWITLWEDDVTLNDKTNAALLFGLPGTTLRLYIRRFYEMMPGDSDNGAFELFIPKLVDSRKPFALLPFALAPDFSNLDPKTKATTPPDAGRMWGVPRTIPRGRSRWAGGGWATDPNDPNSGWRDKISSMVFQPPLGESVCSEPSPPR